jgi:predicted GIY-YIG superfamily endonuclease
VGQKTDSVFRAALTNRAIPTKVGTHASREKLMFYVYLLASKPYGTLYIGTTSDLTRRVWEHKNKLVPGFTKRYQVERLV